jgi:hypothetical protein
MLMRERRLRRLSETSADSPRMVGLRFGTTIGISPVQRTNLFAVAFARAVAEAGFMRVMSPLSVRPVLHLNDLHRLMRVIIQNFTRAQRFDVFNVASFHSSMSRFANEMSALSGAPIFEAPRVSAAENSFAVNCSRFESVYSFKFIETIQSTAQGLFEHSEQLAASTYKQTHSSGVNSTCVVCGNTHLLSVLDLGHQPLANAFVSDPTLALHQEEYRLHLVSCPSCSHVQLSATVNRSVLFKHYLYESGTSRTLINYFQWLAHKVAQECGKPTAGLVIEIAHNDGSQLDQFKNMGWTTHGVDPAANLAAKARAGRHVVHVAFWGVEPIPDLPSPDKVDAIIAQNVLAHVENVTQFMTACAAAMSHRTRLYIQTSQCEMFETGQFDTVYHEHVSFFTAHSFTEAARLSGLEIVNFETTPIHGTSCLVTFMKRASDAPRKVHVSLQAALNQEHASGLKDGRLLSKFKREALSTRTWVHDQLQSLADQGFKIIAYGAAAKGMVLLHFLRQLQRSYDFDFIVDDAPLKQGTYCPGTNIPVLPAANISHVPLDRPLAIIILPWNFAEEITVRIQSLLQFPRTAPVLLVVPFPRQRVMQLHPTISPTEVFPPTKTPSRHHTVGIALVAEFSDHDAAFCQQFIQHHAHMFDFAVVVDLSSTSMVRTAFQAVAPSSWKFTQDSEVVVSSLFEQSFSDQVTWTIKLHGRQLLVHPDIRAFMRDATGPSLQFPVVQVADGAVESFSNVCMNLLCRRTFAVSAAVTRRLPMVRTSHLSFSASSLQNLIKDTSAQDSISASASEGFVADVLSSNASGSTGLLQNAVDLSSVGAESDVMQQAHAAWHQLHNRVLRLGCRGCSALK